MDCGNLHLQGDGGRPSIECTSEDIGKTQNVVDLVRIVRATCRHDGVVTDCLDLLWKNLWRRVGQCKNQGPICHGGHHVSFENTTRGETEEDIRANHHFTQCAGIGLLGELDFVFVHQLGAAFINHTGKVSHENVLAGNAQLNQ